MGEWAIYVGAPIGLLMLWAAFDPSGFGGAMGEIVSAFKEAANQ